MLVSLSLFNFVLSFNGCFVFSVQFRIMYLMLVLFSLFNFVSISLKAYFVFSVQFLIVSLCLFNFVFCF